MTVTTRETKPGWGMAARCAILGGVLGLILWATNLGKPLEALSYDLLFQVRPNLPTPGVTLIFMDERSLRDLNQEPEAWDRQLHANLLDHLTRDGARLVAFDVWLTDPGEPATDAALAEAMRRHGNVLLTATLVFEVQPGLRSATLKLPLPVFLDAAKNWGVAANWKDAQLTVREIYTGDQQRPSLPWQAALLAGAQLPELGSNAGSFWINYYGPQGAINSVSYSMATNQPPGYFKDQIVFIGSRPSTHYLTDGADQFRTPYTGSDGHLTPGVEILATATLNLLHQQWLTRWSRPAELGLLLGAGLLFGFVAGFVSRPAMIGLLAGGGFLVLLIGTAWLAWENQIWFPWLTIAAVQWPAVLLWLLWRHYRTTREGTTLISTTGSPGGAGGGVLIPDHELIRCIGKGAYGEVWLARNEVGILHAVKIVHRNRFAKDTPYQREFQGIQQFMPISRTHPGFVHILHVGRNKEQGCFFCVMEAGDDHLNGTKIQPDTYQPRTLASDLDRLGKLPVAECVRLGLTLAHALDHLHRHQLIHRDIKPANIIYVANAPKFADIGLVTHLASEDQKVSCLGTEGYIAPEGPGLAGADVYSLGKVLYEAVTGRDRRAFPELPTAVLEQDEPDPVMDRLTAILMTACDTDVTKRYLSAAALHSDLLQLERMMRV